MRHCIQVLRNKPGDALVFTDGLGFHYEGTILSANKKGFLATIQSKKAIPLHPKVNIHLAVAPTKNIDRFEWFLEKATEFGVSKITPLLCDNSERKRLRPERLEKILMAAMKQSFGAYLPILNELVPFQSFITQEHSSNSGRFIAHCRSNELPSLFRNSNKGQDVVILVGPEGDFSVEEIDLALAAGFGPVSLGKSRLRTETAGIAAVHIINMKNE